MKLETITAILFSILALCIGLAIGGYLFPKRIPIYERITACENKGGKYNLYYNDILNNYSERCEIVEDEIKEF